MALDNLPAFPDDMYDTAPAALHAAASRWRRDCSSIG